MNVFDEIQASRPDVSPMAVTERRRIRESLFGTGQRDASRSITGRSDSGAVVSTAPYGMRRPIQKRPRATGSPAKLAAGLLVVAAVGALVWSYSTRDDAAETSASTSTTTTQATTSTSTTAAPTTAPPVVRTGVDASLPLALPPPQIPAVASVNPAPPGSSSLVLGAPDGTEIWIAEFDGEPADPSNLDVRQIGGIGVGVARDRVDGAQASYQPQVPCGFVIVNDATGQPLDRQPLLDLFSSMSIDGDATIDITLPTDWSVFSIGETQPTYTAEFQVPTSDGSGATTPLRLDQAPGGALAQLMFGGRQLDPVDFLGAPGFVDVGALDPSVTSVFWQDGETAFSATSNSLTLSEIAQFVDALEPVTVDDWNQRFATVPAISAEPFACAPQPGFGPTLDP